MYNLQKLSGYQNHSTSSDDMIPSDVGRKASFLVQISFSAFRLKSPTTAVTVMEFMLSHKKSTWHFRSRQLSVFCKEYLHFIILSNTATL